MNSFFIYQFIYKTNVNEFETPVSVSVIFCSCLDIDQKELQTEIKTFYENHYQTDQIVVIGNQIIKDELKVMFLDKQDETFIGIPKRQETYLNDNLFLFSFDQNGNLHTLNEKSIHNDFLEVYKNEGLQNIFINRGGLIVSESSHHYVFPSGKHCDRFLRTGNILLYSPEIYFIAFSILSHFDESRYRKVYCDTSSINSIAFALFDLKNLFLSNKLDVSIESFCSYDGLYKNSNSYTKDSFLLISASTSANILKYIFDKHKILERDNIVILFFLASEMDFSNVKDQVLCNLTKNEKNLNGIDFYPTYHDSDCEFCKKGSYAVPVSGDVFLLEKPAIKKILLVKTDREKNLSGFVREFLSIEKQKNILKVHYKENITNKYEIYIDYAKILEGLKEGLYRNYYKKLEHHIIQEIPLNSKYILHLNDEGSFQLARYIFEQLSSSLVAEQVPKILSLDQIKEISENDSGAIVVIGSCISNGKNLLYVSRALRRFEKLKIIYFIGIARAINRSYLSNLKSNLQQGKFGGNTNGFIEVETIFCSNESRKSPWIIETDFLKEIILFITENTPEYASALTFLQERKKDIELGAGDSAKGLAMKIFYPRVTNTPFEELGLRKNFAFFDFTNYSGNNSQADVYFTISNILNSLRNSNNTEKQLKQTVYVRNLLDPSNFNRFNDGIIQASLLRAANADELAYAMDETISLEIYNTLETLIKYYEQDQGEALLEFLYAIAIKKLSITEYHLRQLLEKLKHVCNNEIILCFHDFVKEKLIDEPQRLREKPLKDFI